MKRLVTTMFFSVAVILCEQQTLFAPPYTNFDKVAAPSTDTEVGIIDPDDCPILTDWVFLPVSGGLSLQREQLMVDRVYNGLDDFIAWFQPTPQLNITIIHDRSTKQDTIN